MSKKKGGEQIKRKSTAHPALRRPRPLLLLTFLPFMRHRLSGAAAARGFAPTTCTFEQHSCCPATNPGPAQCSPCIPLRTLETREKL
jgi:hypothetical protein